MRLCVKKKERGSKRGKGKEMECYPLPITDDEDDEEPEEHGDDHGTNRHDQFHIHFFFCTCEMGHMINQTSQKKMTKRYKI